MTESRHLLQHFLATVAYRTQKALRDAPPGFATFRAGTLVRTPHELIWHMTSLVGYARTLMHGGAFRPGPLPEFTAEVERFHATLAALHEDFANPRLTATVTDDQFLQGPLAGAMTHAGQLVMLRRMAGAPVPSENFVFAQVRTDNVSADQPVAPHQEWTE